MSFSIRRVSVCENTVKMIVMWCHLYCVFTYIYSLLIENDICDCQKYQLRFKVFIFAFCVEISSFFDKSFLFLFLLFELSILWYFLFSRDLTGFVNHLSGYFPIVLAMYCRTTYNASA